MAFLEPFQTFGILALLIGWYLLIRGTFEVVFSLAGRARAATVGPPAHGRDHRDQHRDLGDRLAGASAWLLIIWVGITAMIRGITEIVGSVHLREDRDRLAVA